MTGTQTASPKPNNAWLSEDRITKSSAPISRAHSRGVSKHRQTGPCRPQKEFADRFLHAASASSLRFRQSAIQPSISLSSRAGKLSHTYSLRRDHCVRCGAVFRTHLVEEVVRTHAAPPHLRIWGQIFEECPEDFVLTAAMKAASEFAN